MRLTREEIIDGHRKMWNWIADKIEETKCVQDIIGLKDRYCGQNYLLLRSNCFCCEYSLNTENVYIKGCDKCLIDWGSNNGLCKCMDKYEEDDRLGLYVKCIEKNCWEEQAKLARKIANLPERECV